MKNLILALALLSCFACDTAKQSSTTAAAAPESTYVSPPVLTYSEPVPALPADSIPVSYSIKGVAEAPLGFNGMMGDWVSSFDDSEMVRFMPGRYASYYAGEKVVEENMTYYQVCPDICSTQGALDVPCFVLASAYGQTCFAVISQTSELLELSPLGSAGTVLTYYRKKEN